VRTDDVWATRSTADSFAEGVRRSSAALRDGTASKVYRETVVDRPATADPAVLVVGFRLRAVHGQLAHALFRFESLFNTPLFVGFPGFVSKLWVAHDSRDIYRGVYEWDGATFAEDYVRTLWRVLALVCVPGSIHYEIVPGLTRGELLSDPTTCRSTLERTFAPGPRFGIRDGRR
jgi:hypothetical protein